MQSRSLLEGETTELKQFLKSIILTPKNENKNIAFLFVLSICSENKGADQLHGYREADLRICFSICKKPVFSRRGSYTLCHECFHYFKSYFPKKLMHSLRLINVIFCIPLAIKVQVLMT